MAARKVELLLNKTVENLGLIGDVVKVKPGYARNYLLPHALAEAPTPEKIEALKSERAKAAATGVMECEPCVVLGIDPLATDEQIREAWLRQVRANHPDKLMAQGLPEEAIAMANRKLALINDAYDRLRRQRGLVPA